MITKENPSMKSTAESIFLSNADINILEQCRAREDAIAHEQYQKELIERLKSENASLSDANASLSNENIRLKQLLIKNGIKV